MNKKITIKDKDILQTISRYMMDDEFDKTVSREKGYLKRHKEMKRYLKELQGYDLPREQLLTIDRILSANNACNAHYSGLAYIKGMRDCVALLRGLNLI